MKHLRMANGKSLCSMTEGAIPASMLCYIFIDWGTCDNIDQCAFDFGDCTRRDICLVDY